MDDAVVSWLLEKEDPSVRYATLLSLMNRSPSDRDVLTARRAIMEIGLVPQILAKQNEDGSWGEPDRFYTDKYGGTVWNLLLLAEFGADPTDARVSRACEFILQHSQNKATGGFSIRSSAKGDGLASYTIPCLTGNMVFSLIRLGFLADSRVQEAIDWMTTWQRADDGDGPPPQGLVYDRFKMCWGRHSCHMGVAKTLKALVAVPAEQRPPAVSAMINRLTEYFLIHHLYKKSHSLSEVSRPGWLRLGFPLMYQTDILELLDLFASLGIHDPRLQDALAIIRIKQRTDGRWNLENSFNGKMTVRVEQKGKPSKWVTLKALRVLNMHEED